MSMACSNGGETTVSTSASTQAKDADHQTEPCFRLIYRSRSLLPSDADGGEAGLAEILRVSRSNNRNRGVTGALMLYREKDRFAQVLEGPEAEVQALYERIKADPRHDNVEMCEATSAPCRLFNRWAMALVLEHHEPDVPLIATEGGLTEAEPWRGSEEQEQVLTLLRDVTRAYGRSY